MDTSFWRHKTVVVTGGNGFLGQHVVKKLKALGVKKIVIPDSKKSDLRLEKNCLKVTRGAQIVIHLAGNVGGIGYNQANPGVLFYDNLMMGVNLIEASRKNLVGKLTVIGTVCSYPKHTPVPFKEEDLWNGYPEETNAPYGIAKKAMMVMADSYREQYGMNIINLMPVNLYGPGDHFDPKVSHVIPALIKKFVEAKQNGDKEVVVWGTGKATREFFYVEDAAEAIVAATEHLSQPDPINLGSAMEISIKDLTELIRELTEYEGRIVWDTSKPDGQPRRMLDTSKARDLFGFEAKTNFRDGLKKTIAWYQKQVNTGKQNG
jgi:GDP-L-fucose synthase